MKSKEQRMDVVKIVREIFTATGIPNEEFTFEGPQAYNPNGLIDVSIRIPGQEQWEEITADKYELLTTSLGFRFIESYYVEAGTLVRVNYSAVGDATVISGLVDVQQAIPDAPVSATFTTPDALANAVGAGIVLNGIIVLADQDNDDDVFVGPSTVTVANGYRLGAGESCPVPASDISEVYVIAVVAGDKIHYIGG